MDSASPSELLWFFEEYLKGNCNLEKAQLAGYAPGRAGCRNSFRGMKIERARNALELVRFGEQVAE